MVNEQQQQQQQPQPFARPWILDPIPVLVVGLVAVHVLALVYWIYRLATEKQPQQRRKRTD